LDALGVYLVEDLSDPYGRPALVIPTGKSDLQYLFAEAIEYQNAGISQPMHICRLSHNKTYIEALPFDLRAGFPEVATNWQTLVKILGEKGIKVGECIAYAITKATFGRKNTLKDSDKVEMLQFKW